MGSEHAERNNAIKEGRCALHHTIYYSCTVYERTLNKIGVQERLEGVEKTTHIRNKIMPLREVNLIAYRAAQTPPSRIRRQSSLSLTSVLHILNRRILIQIVFRRVQLFCRCLEAQLECLRLDAGFSR